MNFQEFQQNCLVTFKKDDKELSLAHAILGIVSELNELEDATYNDDNTNISEEICDILYYVVVYCHYRGISLEEIEAEWESIKSQSCYRITKFDDIYRAVSKLSDYAKKHIFYEREISDEEEITNLSALLFWVAISHKVDLNVGFDRLINKLKIRYAEKFSAESANNRDLEAERRVLEGK